MKSIKVMLMALLLTMSAGASAQETAKKRPTLPKQGDIGLGIDLVPMFNYVGNIFNNSNNNTLNTFGGQEALDGFWGNGNDIINPAASIMAKYMLTDEIALRANIGIIRTKNINRYYQPDDAALFENPLSEAKVVDARKSYSSGGSISLGAEYRRGYNRIQGYGGVDLIYGFATKKEKYEYGNAITEVNQQPSRIENVAPALPEDVANWTKTYVTGRYHDGNAQYIGFGLHAGVEVFLASHFSVGGEVTMYGIGMFKPQSYQEQEGFNNINGKVETRTELLSPGDRSFNFGTGNLGGKLYMMFYF